MDLQDDIVTMLLNHAQSGGVVREIEIIDDEGTIPGYEIIVFKTRMLKAMASTCNQFNRLYRPVLRRIGRLAYQNSMLPAGHFMYIEFRN